MNDFMYVGRIVFGILVPIAGVFTIIVGAGYFRRFNDSRVVSIIHGTRRPGKTSIFFIGCWLWLVGFACLFFGLFVLSAVLFFGW